MNCCNLFLFIALSLFGDQQKQFVSFIDTEVSLSKEKDVLTIILPFVIQEDYHIQAASEVLDNLIATEISFEQNGSFEIESYEFSLTNYDTVVLNEFTHRVLSDRVEVTVALKFKENKSGKSIELKGELYYQACDDQRCFFPRTLAFNVDL
jgi:hypothetical protein